MKQVSDRYTLVAKQIDFPKASQDKLARLIAEKLNGDYAIYEIRDILDKYGEAVTELLMNGYQVQIPKLGTFYLFTNKAKAYYNVVTRGWFWSHAGITPKFKFVKQRRIDIAKYLKDLLISTFRIQADYPIEKPEKPIKETKT